MSELDHKRDEREKELDELHIISEVAFNAEVKQLTKLILITFTSVVIVPMDEIINELFKRVDFDCEDKLVKLGLIDAVHTVISTNTPQSKSITALDKMKVVIERNGEFFVTNAENATLDELKASSEATRERAKKNDKLACDYQKEIEVRQNGSSVINIVK